MPPKPENHDKQVSEISDLINITFMETHNFICNKINNFTPQQRWLIYARVMNRLWANFFGVSFDLSEKQIKSEELKNEN